MKLTDLSIDGNQFESALSLHRIHPGLNFIQADRKGPLAEISDLLQRVFWGLPYAPGMSSTPWYRGTNSLQVQCGQESFRLLRGDGTPPRLEIVALGSGSNPALVERRLQEASVFPREHFLWDFGGLQGKLESLPTLYQTWHPEFFQAQTFSSHADYIAWKQGVDSRRARAEELRRQLAAWKAERTARQTELDQQQQLERVQRDRHDLELKQWEDSCAAARSEVTRLRNQMIELDLEIETLRRQIHARSVESVTVADEVDSPWLGWLYERLDELDDQLALWSRLQDEIQAERIRLRDEMVHWNEMTLDQERHPYHRAHGIVHELENLVQRVAGEAHRPNADAPAEWRNLVRLVHENGQRQRDSLHQLCDELGSQYKELRHRGAVHELKLLRSFFEEIAGNLESLQKRFQEQLERLHKLDPAGAQAIREAAPDFVAAARRDGFLAARRKFLGSEPAVTWGTVPTGSLRKESESHRLGELLNRRDRLSADVIRAETHLQSLVRDKERFLEQRRLGSAASLESLRGRLEQLSLEIGRTESELDGVNRQLEQDGMVRPYSENPFGSLAEQYLSRLLGYAVQLRWNSSAGRGIEWIQPNGDVRQASQMTAGEQSLVGLAFALANRVLLHRQGTELPVLIERPLVQLNATQAQRCAALLHEMGEQGLQFLALVDNLDQIQDWMGTVARGTYGDFRIATVPAVQTVITSYSAEGDRGISASNRALLPSEGWRDPHHAAYVAPVLGPIVHPEQIDSRPASLMNPLRDFNRFAAQDATDRPGGSPVSTLRAPSRLVPKTELTESSPLRQADLVDSGQLTQLASVGVTTVGNLLDLDPEHLPVSVTDIGFSPTQIDRWQAQAWLLMCVPGLVPSEARLLVACGLVEPEQVEATQADQLLARINRYLVSPDGQRMSYGAERFDQNRIQNWYQSLRATRSRWRRESGYSRRMRRKSVSGGLAQPVLAAGTSVPGSYFERARPRSYTPGHHFASFPRAYQEQAVTPQSADSDLHEEPEPRTRPSNHQRLLEQELSDRAVTDRRPAATRSRPASDAAKSVPEGAEPASKSGGNSLPLKFSLNLTDAVEAAPSIGPKTAERFVAIGIQTIGEFLQMTADVMAERINFKRISADIIRAWQDQTRLVCQVPNLRGHDAQLLVACGIREPQELAQMNPRKLLSLVGPYSETKEGLKIVRSGKKPDLDEVSNWIEWAKHTRSLQAA